MEGSGRDSHPRQRLVEFVTVLAGFRACGLPGLVFRLSHCLSNCPADLQRSTLTSGKNFACNTRQLRLESAPLQIAVVELGVFKPDCGIVRNQPFLSGFVLPKTLRGY